MNNTNQIHSDVINAKNTATTKTIAEDEKCVGNVVNMNLIITLMNENFPTNVPSAAVTI